MSNLKKCGIGLALCFLLVGGATPPLHAATPEVTTSQQARKVSGTVKDTQGEPLLGVNIMVKGTTSGTITDLDGNFSLDVPAGAILIFTYIGYSPMEVPVTGQGPLNVVMREDSKSLDEIVVVGYGTQAKKDITGSVAVVDTKDLLASSGSSATQQLQGKAAGVYVGQTGSPGSATMVRIRGINTVNDNGPLYVIDGVSTRNQNLSTINPNDIESMQVLKDASSAAIYGAQAANGVILITTKKGTKSGQPQLTYDGYFGVQKQMHRYDVLNSQDRLDLEWAAKANNYKIMGSDKLPSHVQFGTGASPIIPNYLTQSGAGGRQDIDPSTYNYPGNTMVKFSDTNWWDEVDQTAPMQNHQIGLSGGTDKGQYTLSANYFDQKGTIIESYYKRYTVRANSSFHVRPWLRIGENFSYTWTKDQGLANNTAESNPYSWSYRSSPWVPVYDIAGNFAGSKIAGTGNWQNTVAQQIRNKDNYWSNSRIFGSLWAEVDLYKGLTFKTNFGMDYTNRYSYRMEKKNLEFSETRGRNDLEEVSNFNFRWVWTNTLAYNAKFNDVHSLNVLLGTEAIRDGLGREMTGQRFDFVIDPDNPNTWVLNNGANNNDRRAESSYNGEFALFGLFARADYAFDNKYLLTGIIRRDGVSRFSASNRYGVFPSISFGWRVSEEGFMDSTRDWLDDLKLRVGYGETGNSEIPRKTNFAFEYTTDQANSNYAIDGGQTSSQGYRLRRYGNPDTKWETTAQTNVGVDATFLGGKFGFSIEGYYKKTTDMLVAAQYSGLANSEIDRPYVNFGDMKNTGLDVTFNYRDSHGDWSWDISANLSTYKNEVVKISQADDFSLWRGGARISGNISRTTKGQPIAMFYGYKQNGFYESEADVLACVPLGQDKNSDEFNPAAFIGKFKFQDTNKDGKLTAEDQTYIGNPHPDLLVGLNANITYKAFDFSMFWYSSIGNDLFNNTKYFTDFWLFEGNRSSRMRDLSWKPGANNSKAILPVLDYGDGYSGTNSNSYYVEDGSFLKLKNVVLGYTLPKALLQKATISNLRVYLQAENCLTLTGYTGLDPELTNSDTGAGDASDLSRGIDQGGWPTPLRLLVGVNFAF